MPATLKSEYYKNQTDELVRYRAASNIANGEFREATLEYKFTGAEASGDILQFGRLDPGVTVQSDNMKCSVGRHRRDDCDADRDGRSADGQPLQHDCRGGDRSWVRVDHARPWRRPFPR